MYKYLNPYKYLSFFKKKLLDVYLNNIHKIDHIIINSKCLDENIRFVVSSSKEYYLRAKLSYIGEKSTVSWIKNYINAEDVVLDIGANVGAYSLLIAKKLESGMVYAAEPEAGNFYRLNLNVRINRLSQEVIPVCIAFGNETKLGIFYLSDLQFGAACHALDIPKTEGISFEPKYQQGIFAMRLDDWVELPSVNFPNHIKIDVDGLEKSIIQGGYNTLRDSRLKTLLIEVSFSPSKGEVEGLVEDAGLKEVDRQVWDSKSGKVGNIVYARQ